MAYVTPDKFSPYPRVCDVCGQLRSIATMRKLDGQTYVCDKHPGERTAIMLDTLNAHARPPQTWPNRDAKPQNPHYPNALEADEAETLNFIYQQVSNQARYELVSSGDGSPLAVDVIATMGWAARYAYKLIVQATRPTRMIELATTILRDAATYLLTKQIGFGISPISTRATNIYYGGFLRTGATSYLTQDAALGGLALLYAYRVIGTQEYLLAARAAASYLRNVQAIGSHANQFTSRDAAGTARLYTGAVCSEVSTTTGIDPGTVFYSNHLFYPAGLAALELWKELQTTDGDQSIGLTAILDGFVAVPAQLLSTSIADMRACWQDGIRDAGGDTVTGLSATTPREYFNAYPAVKIGFTSIAGTGMWEFQDGDAESGTMISGQNFAVALGALYAYEGQSTQVGAVSDWLRTFTSNAEFETPDDTSASVLARSTTGDYDPAVSLSTLLLVRDPDDDYSAIAENGSSLYDWGAFGVLSPLWGARYATSFQNSRWLPLNIQRRYDDGKASDGLYYDRIALRGCCGLSFQTAFGVDTSDGNAPTAQIIGTAAPATAPVSRGLRLWLDGAQELSHAGGLALAWGDQSGDNNDVSVLVGGTEPGYSATGIDGVPAIDNTATTGLDNAASTLVSSGAVRTVMAVVRPSSAAGGAIMTFARTAPDHTVFLYMPAGVQYAWGSTGFGPPLVPEIHAVTPVNYTNTTILVEHVLNEDNELSRVISGANVPLAGDAVAAEGTNGFSIGNRAQLGFPWGFGFVGLISGVLVYDVVLTTAERQQNRSYYSGRYSGLPQIASTPAVNDAIRAAQYGLAYRQAH